MKKHKSLIFILSLVVAIFILAYQKNKNCNNPNSLAEKINFGNNNCLKDYSNTISK